MPHPGPFDDLKAARATPPRPDPRREPEVAPSPVPPPLPKAIQRAPAPTLPGPLPAAPEVTQAAPLSNREGMGPRSVSPPPWASPAEIEAGRRDAAKHGDRVVKPPVSAPQPRQLRWWESANDLVTVAKGVSGAVGALIAGTLVALGTYRATAPAPPPPPPPPDIRCPPFAETNAPRGSLCMQVYQLEAALGNVQAKLVARQEREAREKKMLEQEPPKLTK